MFRSLSSALFAAAVSAASAEYSENGADWGDLCKYGTEQSPINLSTAGATPNDKIEIAGFGYYDFKVNNSFSSTDVTKTISFDSDALRKKAELQVSFADGSQSNFQPLQFHFHSPSEHSVSGKLYDLEIHFVHTVRGSDSATGSAMPEMPGAVIGVFFDAGVGGDYENAFIASVLAAIKGKNL